MLFKNLLFLLVLNCLQLVKSCIDSDVFYYQPEQIHIAFGEKLNDIVVTWTTFNDTRQSIVEYGVGSMNVAAEGNTTLFVDGGEESRKLYIHRVTLRNLEFDTTYVYHVGSNLGWSEKLSFKTVPKGEDWVLRAILYGDMGNENAQSLAYLQEEAQQGLINVILHVGDFAYDMDEDNARIGDEFMRQLQPLASYVPYMTCPGNHEERYNFSNYKNRFSMPGNQESMFYSWDIHNVHFISISTEFYYFFYYGLKTISNQYEWLENDLRHANTEENRAKRPWIIIYGHRPMYCSNKDDIDCEVELTRIGFLFMYGLEPLLKKYNVDLVFWAHEHSYERTWPLYDGNVYNGTTDRGPYHNAGAPVHIVTGSAGCREGRDNFTRNPAHWSAFHAQDYGYTRMKVYNKTHIYFEQVSVDLHGRIIDNVWLTKDSDHKFNLP